MSTDNEKIIEALFNLNQGWPTNLAVSAAIALQRAERDAHRYRWLREQIKNHEAMVRAQGLFWTYRSRREFDRAVDKAMGENS